MFIEYKDVDSLVKICVVNTMSGKIYRRFCRKWEADLKINMEMWILKFIWKYKGTRIAKTIFYKEENKSPYNTWFQNLL